MIEKNSEMEHWVRPVGNSGPLLSNHHNYTHIYVDLSQNEGNNHTVLFLSLSEYYESGKLILRIMYFTVNVCTLQVTLNSLLYWDMLNNLL